MSLFKSLFSSNISKNYEDYSNIYFRWERNGREYGPLDFEDMLTRNWSGPPLEGRFENDSKWKDYSFFEKVLNQLNISNEQISEMNKLGIENVDPNMEYREAVFTLISKREEKNKQKKIERNEKEKLPATKQTIKKLNDLNINYTENITREEAKKLIANFKDQEYLKEIIQYLTDNNFPIFQNSSIEDIINQESKSLPTFDQFDELYSVIKPLLENKVNIIFPESMDRDEMEIFNSKLSQADFEAEDIEEQLKDREIVFGENEFKVVGKLPKKQLLKIRTDIINRYLSGEWNQDKELREIVLKHLPELVFREIEY